MFFCIKSSTESVTVYMKPKESNMRPEKIPLNGRLSEFRQALEEEIDEVKKSGASSTLLNNGQKMEGRKPDSSRCPPIRL